MTQSKTTYVLEWQTKDGHWAAYTGVVHDSIDECEAEYSRFQTNYRHDKFRIIERETKERLFPLRCPVCKKSAVVQIPFMEHRVGCRDNCLPMVKDSDRDIAVGMWNESVIDHTSGENK